MTFLPIAASIVRRKMEERLEDSRPPRPRGGRRVGRSRQSPM